MSDNTVIKLVADLELAGADTVAKQIKKLAKDASLEFNERDFIQKWSRTKDKAGKAFAETIADALKSGFSSRSLSNLTKAFTQLSKQIEEAQIKGASDAAKIHLKALEKRFSKEKEHVKRITQRRQQALEEAEKLAGKTRSEFAEDFAESLRSSMESLKGGDIASVLKGLGKGAQGVGGKALKAGGGDSGKMVTKIGDFLSKLGPALLAVGALAGAVGMLVKMVVDADSKAKELNRTLMESGVTASELADSYGMVGDTMDRVRKTFTAGEGAFAFNRIWGTTAKDHLEILGAYSQAGLTFKEITQGVSSAREEMDRLRDSTSAALAYSKLLGTGTQEMAGNMASWMEDLGTNLQGVQEGLSAIVSQAKESGFGVKRFFGMVLQATSGMSMYNVRLEEAGGLLIRLGKVLGTKIGGDFLQQLTGGFMGEGMQERYKRVMTTGGGRMKGIFQRSAKSTATDFISKLDQLGESNYEAADKFNEALQKFGVTLDPDKMVKQLGSLSASQREQLLATARLSGEDDLVRQLTNLMGVARGATGGTGQMAVGLGGLDLGGKLAAQLAQAQAVIGKPLHEMSVTQLMAFESITGTSGEQLEQLKRISESMHGNFNILKSMAKSGKEYSEEEKKAMVEAYGAVVEGGKVFGARIADDGFIEIGKEISELGDYIQGQGDVFKEAAKEGVPADIQLAQDLVANTTDMTKILEQGVEYWLEQIYGVVESILNIFVSKDEAKERQQALQELSGEIKGAKEFIRDQEKSISRWQAEMRTETPEGKARLQGQIESAQIAIKRKQAGLSQTQDARKALLQDPAKVKWFWEGGGRSKEEFLAEAFGGGGIQSQRREQLAKGGARTEEIIKKGGEMFAEQYLAALEASEDPMTRLILEDQESLETALEQARQTGEAMTEAELSGAPALLKPLEGFQKLQDPEVWKEALENTDFSNLVKEFDDLQKEGKKDAETLHTGKAPSAYAKEWKKAAKELKDEELAEKIQGVLGRSGVEIGKYESLAYARQLRTGETPEALAPFMNQLGLGGPVAQDFLMQIGDGGKVKFAQRISSADTTVAMSAKRGGAISKGGGGGGMRVVHNHFYNDGQGIWNSLRKYEQAMGGKG